MRTMHLFAGVGGGLLADRILGHTPLVAVEWEPYACQVLRERSAEGWFPGLRVWEGDVRLFDPSEYTGIVDCIHAGFPCQDISVAGKQAGVSEGTRSGLYREVLRIAGIVRPRFLFLENVAAIKGNGLEQVIKDMAIMGYDSRWLCLQASDVGAPHERDRWFCLGFNTDSCDANRERRPDTSDFYIEKRSPQENEQEGDIWKSELGTVDVIQRFNSYPEALRILHGIPNLIHRYKALGNGQVPLQVAVAFTILAEGLIDAYT